MGKSKKFQRSQLTKRGPTGGNKGQKGLSAKNVFQVKHTKANKTKHKTKAVTTALNKIVDKKRGLSAMTVNKDYSDLQDMLHRSSGHSATEKKKEVVHAKPQDNSRRGESINIEETMEQLSSL